MRRFLALLLAFPFAASAQAAPLTLGCSGPLTTATLAKDGVAADPITEIVDISVTVDFGKRTVSGFWFDLNGHDLIPIRAADANVIIFGGRKNTPWKCSSPLTMLGRAMFPSKSRLIPTGLISAISR